MIEIAVETKGNIWRFQFGHMGAPAMTSACVRAGVCVFLQVSVDEDHVVVKDDDVTALYACA